MDWKIVQCCEPGKKHESSVCQDNCFKLEDTQYKVMALCDGTSDAEFSDLGSKWVAEFTARYFKKHFDSLYNIGFAKICEVLTEYHQQLLMYLSECAAKEKGISIVVDRKINNQELRKYCTTVQVLAVKNGKAVYYKVGNGAAIIVGPYGYSVLSDSSTESPTKHVTLPNTLSVLGCSDFQCFELNDDDYYDVILMTDGVEFSKGLFYNHNINPEFDTLVELTKNILFTNVELKEFILKLRNSIYNTAQDDIGISILHNTSVWFKKESKRSDSTISYSMQSVGSEADNQTVVTPSVSDLTNVSIPTSTGDFNNSSSAVMNDDQTQVSTMNNSSKEIQIPTVLSEATEEANSKDYGEESDDNSGLGTETNQHNKKKVKKASKSKNSKEQQFLKKVVVHLLIAFIAGTFLGGMSSSLMNSRKIEVLSEKIDQLSEDIVTLSSVVEELKAHESTDESHLFEENEVDEPTDEPHFLEENEVENIE